MTYNPRLEQQVEKHTIKERARKLRMEGLKNLKKHLSTKIGQKDLILVENNYNKKHLYIYISKMMGIYNNIIWHATSEHENTLKRWEKLY